MDADDFNSVACQRARSSTGSSDQLAVGERFARRGPHRAVLVCGGVNVCRCSQASQSAEN